MQQTPGESERGRERHDGENIEWDAESRVAVYRQRNSRLGKGGWSDRGEEKVL